MKITVLIFLLAGGSMVFADDSSNLLRNGDFSSGLAEWEGDCHTPGNATDDSGATSGVVVKLRHTEWTQMTQDFEGKEGRYKLTLTYTITPGLSFSTRPDDYVNAPAKLGYGALRPFNAPIGKWVMIINDTGAGWYHWTAIEPNPNTQGLQTIQRPVQLETASDSKGFYLCFPPGDGTINIQSITLSPMDGQSP